MKRAMIILVSVSILLFILGCSKENWMSEEDRNDTKLFDEVVMQLREDPDSAVGRCQEFLTPEKKEMCYTTYVNVKILRNENIDPAFCEKVYEVMSKEKCLRNR